MARKPQRRRQRIHRDNIAAAGRRRPDPASPERLGQGLRAVQADHIAESDEISLRKPETPATHKLTSHFGRFLSEQAGKETTACSGQIGSPMLTST